MLVLVQHNPDNANEPRRSGALMAITPTTAEDDAESDRRLNVCKAYRDGGHPNFTWAIPSSTPTAVGRFVWHAAVSDRRGDGGNGSSDAELFGITFSVPTNMKDLIEIQIRIEPDNDKLPNAIYPVIQGRRLPDSAAGRGAISLRCTRTPMVLVFRRTFPHWSARLRWRPSSTRGCNDTSGACSAIFTCAVSLVASSARADRSIDVVMTPPAMDAYGLQVVDRAQTPQQFEFGMSANVGWAASRCGSRSTTPTWGGKKRCLR